MPENPKIESEELEDRLTRAVRVLVPRRGKSTPPEQLGFDSKALERKMREISTAHYQHHGLNGMLPAQITDLCGKMFLMGVVFARQELSQDDD